MTRLSILGIAWKCKIHVIIYLKYCSEFRLNTFLICWIREWDKLLEKQKLKGTKPILAKALWAVFGNFYLLTAFALCIDECILRYVWFCVTNQRHYMPLISVLKIWTLYRVAQPIFLRLYVRSFSNSSSSEEQILYAAGVCVASFLHVILQHSTFFGIHHLSMKCRAAASSLLYRKVSLTFYNVHFIVKKLLYLNFRWLLYFNDMWLSSVWFCRPYV